MLNKEIMVIQLLSETHGWLHFFYLPWNTTSIFSLEGVSNLISGKLNTNQLKDPLLIIPVFGDMET